MKTMKITYPESIPAIPNVSPESFEEEARMALLGFRYGLRFSGFSSRFCVKAQHGSPFHSG